MKTNIIFLSTCMLAALFISSCDKSDSVELESVYHRVRVYDDTLPDPRTRSIHCAASDGRLLLTYGNTFEQVVVFNGNFTLPPPSQNCWMLTDNEGNLIRKDMFPVGPAVGDVTALTDNSFLIVTNTGVPNMWGTAPWTLQIMRLDPNGVMGPVDSLHPPTIHPPPYDQMSEIHLCAVPNGNALIYFGYGWGTFVGEMDTHGNFIWYKEFENRNVSSCVSTNDGGYMVSGRWSNSADQTSGIYFMKTNSTFDSTWCRSMIPEYGVDGSVQIALAGNGNFWINYLYSNAGKAYSQLLEINDVGEIVKSSSYPILSSLSPYNLSNVLLKHGESGIFISHSNTVNSFNSTISDQFNAMYATLDANLNVTNESLFQDQNSDMIKSACRTSDGKIACFGITQIYDRAYYKPELIIIN